MCYEYVIDMAKRNGIKDYAIAIFGGIPLQYKKFGKRPPIGEFIKLFPNIIDSAVFFCEIDGVHALEIACKIAEIDITTVESYIGMSLLEYVEEHNLPF